MFLLRVILPDRPGSLGAVATALGDAHADINAVEIVEKANGYAIDDFMLTLPPDARPDALVSACAGLPGVEVMWVSFYPEAWGLTADTDILEEMTDDPEHAESILLREAPAAFHATWALVIDCVSGDIADRTSLAPADRSLNITALGDLSVPRLVGLPAGWSNGWGEHAVASAPFRHGRSAIVVGRPGPDFRNSELARLKHLALLADALD